MITPAPSSARRLSSMKRRPIRNIIRFVSMGLIPRRRRNHGLSLSNAARKKNWFRKRAGKTDGRHSFGSSLVFSAVLHGDTASGLCERSSLALGIILVSAFLYLLSGQIAYYGQIRPVAFWEALYLSVITYTTVGFGDFLPLGWARLIAVHEALAGVFLTPLFLVALTRRYPRMHL